MKRIKETAKFAARLAVAVAVAPVFVPVVIVYAYCCGGGDIKGC